VLAQRWAERKRRILVITPSNLRKQWHQELTAEFFLPCRILGANGIFFRQPATRFAKLPPPIG
jgi:hypothetical protein